MVHSGVIWHSSFILFSNWFNAVVRLKWLSSCGLSIVAIPEMIKIVVAGIIVVV